MADLYTDSTLYNYDKFRGQRNGEASGAPVPTVPSLANNLMTSNPAAIEADRRARGWGEPSGFDRGQALLDKAATLAQTPGTKITAIRALTEAGQSLVDMEYKRQAGLNAQSGNMTSLADIDQRQKQFEAKLPFEQGDLEYKKNVTAQGERRLNLEDTKNMTDQIEHNDMLKLRYAEIGQSLDTAKAKLNANAFDKYSEQLAGILKNPKFFIGNAFTPEGKQAKFQLDSAHKMIPESGYREGDTFNGFKFTGGDWRDKSNWEAE